jgi:hypothetical protein
VPGIEVVFCYKSDLSRVENLRDEKQYFYCGRDPSFHSFQIVFQHQNLTNGSSFNSIRSLLKLLICKMLGLDSTFMG